MAIKFLNTVQVDTDVLYVDTTNDRVGIGTTSPGSVLDVDGTTTLRKSLKWGQITGGQVQYMYRGDGGIFAQQSTSTNNLYSSTNSFRIKNSADTGVLLTVKDAGNVGIGTTSPQRNLTIYESSGNAVLQLANSTSGVNASDGFLAYTDGVNVGLENKENGYLSLATNASEKMRILANGNVGIGATSPASKLSVGGNVITTKKPTAVISDETAGASLVLRGLSPILSFDRTGANPQNKILMDTAGLEFKTGTLDAEGDVDFKINPDGSLQLAAGAQISNQENTDIDSAAAEVVAQVAISYTAAFFDFVVKKGTNIRSGTVYACHDGTNVEFTETSTNDLGNTSDVVLSVDKTSTNLRLIATVASDDWSVKSLIRAI